MNIKFFPSLVVGLIFLVSCTQVDELEQLKTQLSKKKTKLETVKKSASDLRKEIDELESQIAQIQGIEVRKGKLVTAIPVKRGSFKHYIEVQGTAKSEKNISVNTDVGGLVEKIYVEEGAFVKKGQTLAQLDNLLISQNIEELKTTLELARTVYEKQKILWDQNIGSEIQYLKAKNDKESLEKKLQTAYTQLDKTRIKSPIEGTVDEVFMKLGEMASPGIPLIRVVNVDKIEIDAAVPENYLGAVKKGDKVSVYFPALELEKEAEVKSVGQVINPNNRTFNILVTIDNNEKLLKPNLLSVIRILDYSNDDVVSIPNRLVHFGRNDKFVYLVKEENGDKVASKKVVKLGITYEGLSEVLSGLEAGDVLIDEGYRDVTNGELLSIASNNQSSLDGRESE